jgi:molecular chaperone DnaJ
VLSVPMHDAVLGGLAEIESFDGPLKLDIEAGAQSGDVITIKGKGMAKVRGGGRGDLRVTLHVETPTKLDSKQKDLFKQLADLRKGDSIGLKKHKTGFFGREKRR